MDDREANKSAELLKMLFGLMVFCFFVFMVKISVDAIMREPIGPQQSKQSINGKCNYGELHLYLEDFNQTLCITNSKMNN